MDIADQADSKIQASLDAKIASRARFTEWDGNPRDCRECGLEVSTARLRVINASTCIYCAEKIERKS